MANKTNSIYFVLVVAIVAIIAMLVVKDRAVQPELPMMVEEPMVLVEPDVDDEFLDSEFEEASESLVGQAAAAPKPCRFDWDCKMPRICELTGKGKFCGIAGSNDRKAICERDDECQSRKCVISKGLTSGICANQRYCGSCVDGQVCGRSTPVNKRICEWKGTNFNLEFCGNHAECESGLCGINDALTRGTCEEPYSNILNQGCRLDRECVNNNCDNRRCRPIASTVNEVDVIVIPELIEARTLNDVKIFRFRDAAEEYERKWVDLSEGVLQALEDVGPNPNAKLLEKAENLAAEYAGDFSELEKRANLYRVTNDNLEDKIDLAWDNLAIPQNRNAPTFITQVEELARFTIQKNIENHLLPISGSGVYGVQSDDYLVGEQLMIKSSLDLNGQARRMSTLAGYSIPKVRSVEWGIYEGFQEVFDKLDAKGLSDQKALIVWYNLPQIVDLLDVSPMGSKSPGYKLLKENEAGILALIQEKGWPTTYINAYDRVKAGIASFPDCHHSQTTCCVNSEAFFRTLVEPTALGLRECAFSGMMDRCSPVSVGGIQVYPCSIVCGNDMIRGLDGAEDSTASEEFEDRWGTTSSSDFSAMRSICRNPMSMPSQGAALRSGCDEFFTETDSGLGTTVECIAEALGGPKGKPRDAGEESSMQGLPGGVSCEFSQDDGSTPAEPPPQDEGEEDEPGTLSKIWNAIVNAFTGDDEEGGEDDDKEPTADSGKGSGDTSGPIDGDSSIKVDRNGRMILEDYKGADKEGAGMWKKLFGAASKSGSAGSCGDMSGCTGCSAVGNLVSQVASCSAAGLEDSLTKAGKGKLKLIETPRGRRPLSERVEPLDGGMPSGTSTTGMCIPTTVGGGGVFSQGSGCNPLLVCEQGSPFGGCCGMQPGLANGLIDRGGNLVPCEAAHCVGHSTMRMNIDSPGAQACSCVTETGQVIPEAPPAPEVGPFFLDKAARVFGAAVESGLPVDTDMTVYAKLIENAAGKSGQVSDSEKTNLGNKANAVGDEFADQFGWDPRIEEGKGFP